MVFYLSVKLSIVYVLGGKVGVLLISLYYMILGFKDGWIINLNEVDINNVRFRNRF